MKAAFSILLIGLVASSIASGAAITLNNDTVLEGTILEINGDSAKAIVTIPLSMLQNESYKEFPKPEKRDTPSADSFLIVQGGAIPAPINIERLEEAIRKGLIDHGYRIISSEPGIIEYRLENNKLSLDMKFCYASDEYWYEYVDSEGLDANVSKNYINRRYFRWINILEREIAEVY